MSTSAPEPSLPYWRDAEGRMHVGPAIVESPCGPYETLDPRALRFEIGEDVADDALRLAERMH